MIDLDSLATFTEAYPERIARITHTGDQEPLFTVPRLSVLAGSLPRSSVIARDADTGEPVHGDMPPPLLIQGAAGMRTDICLEAIDQDTDYKDLVRRIARPLAPLTKAAGAPINAVESQLFVSAPGVNTDPATAGRPCLIFQCRGTRTVVLDDGTVDDIDLPAGTALYLPPGETYLLKNGDEVSVSLVMKLDSVSRARPMTLLDRLTAWLPKLK